MKDDVETSGEETYYFILEFLEKESENGTIPKDKLAEFKKILRNNKYVSTYIRALKLQMKGLEKLEDFETKQIRWNDNIKNRDWEDLVHTNVRQILGAYCGLGVEKDPIKIINNLVKDALAREGKICDFRDSIHPDKIIGICQNENHDEIYREKNWMQDDWDKWHEITNYTDKEPDEEMPVPQEIEELELTLYTDEDISKFNDEHTCYVCKTCMDYITEHGECEVSCDMGG